MKKKAPMEVESANANSRGKKKRAPHHNKGGERHRENQKK